MSGAADILAAMGRWKAMIEVIRFNPPLARAAFKRSLHQLPMLFFLVSAVLGLGLGSLGTLYLRSQLGFSNESLPQAHRFLLLASIGITGVSGYIFRRSDQRAWLVVLLFCTIGFAIRQMSASLAFDSATIASLACDDYEPAILDACVDVGAVLRKHPLADAPSRRPNPQWQTQVEAEVIRVRVGKKMKPATGRVLIVISGNKSDLSPGDRIRVFGEMRKFAGPTNPGQRDLRTVYRRRGLHARVDVDSLQQIELQQSSRSAYRPAAAFARHGRQLLMRHISDRTAPLAIALVVGQREFVDSQTRDDLLVTGTAHLLSVSGLHLAIVVGLAKLFTLMIGMPRWVEFALIGLVAVAYVAVTGARPPVVRAAILISVVLLALSTGRSSQPINTLSFAALVLFMWNPFNISAVGVHLSFLAVATLLLCGRPEGDTADRIREREERLQQLAVSSRSWFSRAVRICAGKIWQLVWFSLCVTAITTPLIWYHFHVISPISVVANVVLSPLLAVTLASGIATVFLGSIWSPLGDIAGTLCSFCLESMRLIIEVSASIAFGHGWWPSPPLWWVIAFYVLMTLSLFWPSKLKFIRYAGIGLWIIVGCALATTPAPIEDDTLEATFVDVGHGTCVILRFGRQQVWLYDCGRLANHSGSSRDIDVALWSLGVRHLDGIFVSHADSDHYNAIPGILRRFRVDQIVTPPGMIDQDEAGSLEPIRQAISRYQVPVKEVATGDPLPVSGLNGFKIQVMHPPRQPIDGSDNANSLVLALQNKGHTLVLPGDLEPPGTQYLINQTRPRVGCVLMAPHHGSLSMNADAVLHWSRPSTVVVSGNRKARRPAVSEMLKVTGSRVHVTAKAGAIRVRIRSLDPSIQPDLKSETVQVREWLNDPW